MMKFRSIKKNEIRPVARFMADSFMNYPLYDVFFPNEKKKAKGIFYFCWFRIYTRWRYTKISEDGNVLCCVKRPGDREVSPLGLYCNPAFLLGFLFAVPLRALRLVKEFGRFEKEIQNKYYRPDTDAYLQVLCVDRTARAGDLLMQSLIALELDKTDVYLETHTRIHERLYRMYGAVTLEKTPFHGVDHIVMKREKATVKS